MVQPWKSSSPTRTVVVGSGTTFYEPGANSAHFADLCVGDGARAAGTTAGTTVTAAKVWFSPPQGSGSVESVNGDSTAGFCGSSGATGSFTGGSKRGTSWTADVTGTTIFTEHNSGSVSFANVCVGGWVTASGTRAGTTVSAGLVVIRGTALHTPGPTNDSGLQQWTRNPVSAGGQSSSSPANRWQGNPDGIAADGQVRSGGGGRERGPGSPGPAGGSGRGGR